MTPITHNNLPMAECPHCGNKWQIDDYYRLDVGDDIECPACEKTIYVMEIYSEIFARLSTKMP